jgi:hypothetical protein
VRLRFDPIVQERDDIGGLVGKLFDPEYAVFFVRAHYRQETVRHIGGLTEKTFISANLILFFTDVPRNKIVPAGVGFPETNGPFHTHTSRWGKYDIFFGGGQHHFALFQITAKSKGKNARTRIAVVPID